MKEYVENIKKYVENVESMKEYTYNKFIFLFLRACNFLKSPSMARSFESSLLLMKKYIEKLEREKR